MAQTRGAGTPQAVRLPAELLERIDRHTARREAELHLSVSRSDARRRLLSLAWTIPKTPPRRKRSCGPMNHG